MNTPISHLRADPGDRAAGAPAAPPRRAAQRGQVLVIFAGATLLLTLLLAVVVDVSWYWASTLRVQRAADAAALAGAVYLPGDVPKAVTRARDEATKNGYANGVNATVTPVQDPLNNRQLNVTLTANVGTFFMRVIGIGTIPATRVAKAEYVLPVPMGSPENYYGAYGPIRKANGTSIPLTGPGGAAITPRGFWAEMLSQGAETINGDAYLPYYDRRTSAVNSIGYDQTGHYIYAVEIPPGATGGTVSLFDPGFCHGDLQYGTGDNWVTGTGTPVSAFYNLYDTNNTPYYTGDDTLVASSGNTFRRSTGKDGDYTAAADTPGPVGCDAYHMKWYTLAAGLSGGAAGGGGKTYWLYTTTADPSLPDDQKGTNARNGFAIYVSASGGTGTPRVYGKGSMEMYTPLPGGQSSEFYLAQIDAIHAGKTMEIRLWDPGDTNQNANIQILKPTASGWVTATFSWTAAKGTTNSGASYCTGTSGTNVTSVATYASGSKFNGCWLTIRVKIDTAYAAPLDGWWRIRYNMLGAPGTSATDITTWEVNIRGNPVHLKVP